MADKEFIELNNIQLCRIYIKTFDTEYNESSTKFKVYKEYLKPSDGSKSEMKLVRQFQEVTLDITGVIYFINKIQDIPSDIYFIIPNLLGFNRFIKKVKNNMKYFHNYIVLYTAVKDKDKTSYVMINKNDLNSKALSHLLDDIDNFMIMVQSPHPQKMLLFYCDLEFGPFDKSIENYFKILRKLIAIIRSKKNKTVTILSGYFGEYNNIYEDILDVINIVNLSQYYFKANGLYLKIYNDKFDICNISDIAETQFIKTYINGCCERFKVRIEYPPFS